MKKSSIGLVSAWLGTVVESKKIHDVQKEVLSGVDGIGAREVAFDLFKHKVSTEGGVYQEALPLQNELTGSSVEPATLYCPRRYGQ